MAGFLLPLNREGKIKTVFCQTRFSKINSTTPTCIHIPSTATSLKIYLLNSSKWGGCFLLETFFRQLFFSPKARHFSQPFPPMARVRRASRCLLAILAAGARFKRFPICNLPCMNLNMQMYKFDMILLCMYTIYIYICPFFERRRELKVSFGIKDSKLD